MNISRRKDKESNRPCVSEQATLDISNGHWGLERSRYCERPPISAINMKLKRTQKNKVIRKKFYITKLEQPVIKAQFSLKLHNKYDILQDYDETDDEEVEKQWLYGCIQRNSSRSTGVQKERAKTMDLLGVGASRREKTTEEQHCADKVRQD